MIDSEHHKRGPIGGELAVFAGASASGKLVRAEDVLRAEVPRATAVNTGEEAGHLLGCDCRQPAGGGMITGLQGLIDRGPDVPAHRVVASHRLVGALQYDYIFLSGQRVDDSGFREGANHIEVDGANLRASALAK